MWKNLMVEANSFLAKLFCEDDHEELKSRDEMRLALANLDNAICQLQGVKRKENDDSRLSHN